MTLLTGNSKNGNAIKNIFSEDHENKNIIAKDWLDFEVSENVLSQFTVNLI